MKSHRPFSLAWICLAVSLLFTGGLIGQVVTTSSSTRPISEQFRWMPVPATLTSPGKPGDFASDGTDLYIYTGTGRPPHSWIVAGSGGGSGTVTSVNGNTGAVTVQPLPTFAALASDAITLGHDGITRTDTISATKNLTLASAGSTGDERTYEFYFASPQTVTTNFAVFRNWATASANISKTYSGKVTVTIRNMGGGEYRWYDNDYGAGDIPVGALADGMTATTQAPLDNSTKLATTAYVEAAVAVGGIGGGGSFPVEALFPFPTASLGSKPLNSLVADGTNGTINAGTMASGTATWLQMGYGAAAIPEVTNGIVAGTYTGTQNVGVGSATIGASLYYTFGSSPTDPTTSDTLVSGTIPVAATGTLKVKAFKNLHTPSSVFSAAYTINPAFSYLYANELVYANTGAATSDGWTTAGGSPNYSYSASTISGFATNMKLAWGDSTYHAFTATGNVSFCIKVKVVDASSSASQAIAITDGTTNLAKISFGNTGLITLGYGTTGGGSVTAAYSTLTNYWLWFDRVKSTGVIKAYLSTSGIKPGSPTLQTTSPYTTQDATRIYLQATTSSTFIFNDLFVSGTPIGDNP